MNSQGINLFIVDDKKQMVSELKHYLENRFVNYLNITEFSTGESCLQKVDQNTHFVILAYYLNGKNGNEILKLIKRINPKTEVVMLSSNEEIGTVIESFQAGAADYIIKGDKAWDKLIPHIYRIIVEPIRRLGKEYGLPKFLSIFFGAFIFVGLLVYFVLKLTPL